MNRQLSVSEETVIGDRLDHATYKVTEDVAYQRQAIVNLAFIGAPGTKKWVLVDAGMVGMSKRIEGAVRDLYGGIPPVAIILTHGHFDHVGSLKHLAEEWRAPIYSSKEEMPYLDGTRSYSPPDPTVGGGLMATLSPLFPRGPIDVTPWLRPLPSDGSIAELPGWRWLATPGHSPGHISLWRESDQLLIAGDAFVTTRQESAYSVAKQKPEVHGPPKYFTPDWSRARDSVRRLADLEPNIVITGHGPAMEGPEMLEALHLLADRFEDIAVPEQGRYVTAR